MQKIPNKLPKGVSLDRDFRKKQARYYFRAPGKPKVRLRETPGTDAFEAEVACARLGVPYVPANAIKEPPVLVRAPKEGTFQWLATEYKRRVGDKINPGLFGRRSRMYDEISQSKIGAMFRGDLPYAEMERRHVTEIRDELRKTPGARNHVIKSISALFSWAIEAGIAETNPASRIKKLDIDKSTHTWTVSEIRQFEARHPAGTRARLMLHLAMYTGLRLADLSIVGRQHIKDGWLIIRPGKTRKSSRALVEIPVLPNLQKTIDESPVGDLTFITTEAKKPFTANGLGNKMRDWCDQALLYHCSTHGLRKAGATIAAENGATDEELMAIYGWVTKSQTVTYTKNANRKRIAKNAVSKLIPEQNSTENVPRNLGLANGGAKTP